MVGASFPLECAGLAKVETAFEKARGFTGPAIADVSGWLYSQMWWRDVASGFDDGPASLKNDGKVIPILVEEARIELRNGVPSRIPFGRIEYMQQSLLRRSVADARELCLKLVRISRSLAEPCARSVLLVFNARGASPLAFAGYEHLDALARKCIKEGAPSGATFATRDGERRLLRWASSAPAGTVIPISHFKISSRRFVVNHLGVSSYGGVGESWRLRMTWCEALDSTLEYVPSEFIDACAAGIPIVFVDIPSRHRRLATSSGVLQTEKERTRHAAGACDPYKLAPLLSSFGYSLFSASPLDANAHTRLGRTPPALPRASGWCLIVNPDNVGLHASFDNRPQLCPPWGTEYSEYLMDGKLMYIDPITNKHWTVDVNQQSFREDS